MKRFKDAEHLLRLGGLFLFGLLVFGIARAELVPATFGTLGHYRAQAIDDVRAKPIGHAGQAACAECHADVVDPEVGSVVALNIAALIGQRQQVFQAMWLRQMQRAVSQVHA